MSYLKIALIECCSSLGRYFGTYGTHHMLPVIIIWIISKFPAIIEWGIRFLIVFKYSIPLPLELFIPGHIHLWNRTIGFLIIESSHQISESSINNPSIPESSKSLNQSSKSFRFYKNTIEYTHYIIYWVDSIPACSITTGSSETH